MQILPGYAMYCEVPPQVLDQLKQYLEDYKFLSGTSACRWYINENDIPAMRTFQRGLPSLVTPIKKLELQSEDYMEQGVEEKTLFDLKQIDHLTDKNKRFQCTVTLISIPEKEEWCYRACRVCNSRMIPSDDGYQCTKIDGCSCKQYDWKCHYHTLPSSQISYFQLF